jgi:2-hydroxy-3-oxopropionate reductase
MLPNGSHVKSVALGEGGLAENAKQGTLLIDMSSISTTDSIEINESLKEKGLRMIDAPVSGAFTGALEGKLAIMVGGEEADVKDAMPVLSCMGSKIVHIGPAGSGCTCKLANNIIIANNLAAVCEAMMFAKKAGCDLSKVFEVVSAGFAGSTAMNSQVPRMLAQNYEPGFTIKLHHKDLTNALAAGANVGSPMPLAQHMKDVMDEMIEDGLGLKDNSGIALYYEKLANDKYVD